MPSPLRQLTVLLGIAVTACAGTCLAAQPAEPPAEAEFIPRGAMSIDEKTGEIIATEGAEIHYENWLLSADNVRFNRQTNEATATGHVVFSREGLRLIADKLIYRPTDEFVHVENFRAGNGRYYLDGSLIEGNPDNFQFRDINFYPGEPGTFLFVARAGELALLENNVIRGKRLFFKVGAVPFLLIPNITQPLDAETNLFKPNLDYSGHIGAAIGAEALAPVGKNLRLGANVAFTSKRGILAGPAARYRGETGNGAYEGSFISGFINDSGELGDDVNGQPIDSDRSFAEWQHQQVWGANRASLSTYLRYWSDSEVTRDFYDESFDRMQDPDSYAEANYNGENWQLSLFARAALSEFQTHTERLPELRFQYYPTTIVKGLTQSGYVSAAKLQTQRSIDLRETDATRLDAFYGLEYNKALVDGVNLRLKAGARGYRYDDATINYYNIADDYIGSNTASGQRAFGEFGADLDFKAYSVYELKDETWAIDGLRHIIEPRISYRYTPEIDVGDELPYGFSHYDYGYDYLTFGNYLQPIDIEDRRDVDSLAEEQKIRFELRNRLETRAKEGGSRELASLNLAADYYLDGSLYGRSQRLVDGELESAKGFSLMQTELTLTPAPWLEVDALTRLDPENGFAERETSARVVFQDPNYWRIGFGANFLKGGNPDGHPPAPFDDYLERPFYGYRYNSSDIYLRPRLEQYYAFLEYNFNENLKLYAITRYDAQSDVFYDQAIGIMQRALERYGLKYEIRFYDGDRREQDIGITIGVDLFDE